MPEDKPYYLGHRDRVRAKLAAHGARVFEDYELLEMLLFHSIQQRDTKRSAKELLLRFGGLSGIFSADAEELCEAYGVGERSAQLLKTVGKARTMCSFSDSFASELVLDGYQSTGEYIVRLFTGRKDSCVLLLSFDNGMRLIGMDELYRLDYESAAIKPESFVLAALRRQAAFVAIAHNHTSGVLFPTEGDRASNAAVRAALENAGIPLVEHYIVCADACVGFMNHLSAPMRFAGACESDSSKEFEDEGRSLSYLTELLSFAISRGQRSAARNLLRRYGDLEGVLTTDFDGIVDTQGCSPACAYLLRLTSELESRAGCELMRSGSEYDELKIKNYLSALFFGAPRENIYVLTFDKKRRFMSAHHLGEGTVNASELLPRRMLDIAVSSGAGSVILAHNHPKGSTAASVEDVALTERAREVLASVGVGLVGHFIIAGADARRI